MRGGNPARRQFVYALLIMTAVSLALFAADAWRNRSLFDAYLVWNLFLSWLPLLFAARLMVVLRSKLWSGWEALAFSVLWLVFLPNSFYMISDYIHLQDVPSVDILFDAVMLTSFVSTALIIGFSSLYMVHVQLVRRLKARLAGVSIGVILLLCGFAIYLGRDLRWNSWDLFVNWGGLLFDVSDRLLHPRAYPGMFLTTLSFAVLLGALYWILLSGIRLLKSNSD